MVNEVNKLIYNTLISDRAVLLPDVGTLFISREAAKEMSRGRVESHRYTLSFSSNKAAVSLIDIIARVGVDLVCCRGKRICEIAALDKLSAERVGVAVHNACGLRIANIVVYLTLGIYAVPQRICYALQWWIGLCRLLLWYLT